MNDTRIVTELFLEKSDFRGVSKVAGLLEKGGIKIMIMPPEDRGIGAHLVVENEDVPRAREALRKLGLRVNEKEVVLAKLENRPGTMAEATGKLAAAGINLFYAFSLTMYEKSYVLFGSSDNQKALAALQ
ncbi:MAG: hypothetical protein PHV13_02910 [Candidatus ainarchaeum sp.]|nr:hypothetical protein [Candidatus ainarchaeum sp.]